MGRQWPPTPGPGVNFMNPNGFVAAASTTFQMSMPSSLANMASSLISAMLTCRNVFSSSLAISASAGLPTGTVRSTSREKNASTAASDASSMPETTFGVLTNVCVGLPGSMRSGE